MKMRNGWWMRFDAPWIKCKQQVQSLSIPVIMVGDGDFLCVT
jgi:hypothetical protein